MKKPPSFLRRWWRVLLAIAAGFVLRYALTSHDSPKPEAQGAPPDYAAERARKDSVWRYAAASPLPDSMRPGFRGLRYFPADPKWRVEARYTSLSTLTPLLMPMHNAEAPEPYVRVARLSFTLGGKSCTLTALRRPTEPADARLFVPFTDGTNGSTTYGGGRYLDVPAPSVGQTHVMLDFNLAYAPICAHVASYVCPVPPPENRLPVAVAAGER